MKIGIPKSLLYYNYYPLWKCFFEELGAEVICSADTNKRILDYGVKLCVDEACLPVKIQHGHVKYLVDKVDAVFVPRIISINKNEYICPKFCGLPEMVKNSIPDLPYIIDTTVNLRKSQNSIYQSIINAASIITKDKIRIMKAYKNAQHAQLDFEKKLKISGDFDSAAYGYNDKSITSIHKIALLGHPYNIYDRFINMDIKNKLKKLGYQVITPEMIDEDRINRNAYKMPKRHFWTFGRRMIGVGLSFIENHDIDGIIYLSSFGCGIDSLMEDYLERHIKRDSQIPYMKLTLDEHSGDAGLNTRLEAFIDMVKWREENESNISTYGRNIRSSKKFS